MIMTVLKKLLRTVYTTNAKAVVVNPRTHIEKFFSTSVSPFPTLGSLVSTSFADFQFSLCHHIALWVTFLQSVLSLSFLFISLSRSLFYRPRSLKKFQMYRKSTCFRYNTHPFKILNPKKVQQGHVVLVLILTPFLHSSIPLCCISSAVVTLAFHSPIERHLISI